MKLQSLLDPIDPTGPPDDDTSEPEPLYQEWGFTLYRAAYGPGTNRQWAMLVETIRTHIRVTLRRLQEKAESDYDEEEPEAAQTLLDLFRLDPRSDYDTLQGKDMDELRDLYKVTPFTCLYASANMVLDDGEEDRPHPKRFLLADHEVLKRVGEGIFHVKCVDAGFFERNDMPSNRKGVEKTYHGWMQMTTMAIFSLLEYREESLQTIAQPTLAGQPVPTWTGEDPLLRHFPC